MFEKLKGYRTYIVAVCVGLVTVAHYLGWLSPETTAVLLGLLGATGVATMRAAIK